MSEFDDLISEFGSGPKEKVIVTPHADLIKEFGSGNVQAAAPVAAEPQAQITYNPDGTPNPPRFVGTNVAGSTPGSYKDKLYSDAVTEEYAKSKEQFGKGFGEIGSGMSATGVGNVALGGLGMVAAPITPIVKGAEDIVNKIWPANPQGIGAGTGDKLTMILPIKGAGNYAKAQLPSNIAVERLVEAIGKENLPEVIRRMKADERISPMDVSNSTLQVAQKLAVTEGKHQNVLNDFSTKRVAGSNEAVKAAFDESLGVPVNALDKINELKEKARTTGRTAINPLVEKGKPADITPVIKNLETGFGTDPVAKQTLKQIKAGQDITGPGLSPYQHRLLELRQDLTGEFTGPLRDIKGEQGLHEKQMALRREAQDLIDSPDPSNRRLGNRLMDLRNKIVDVIDKSAPGYKEALGKYADDMQVQEAFERGFSLFGKSPKITNRPEFLIDELKNEKRPEVIEALKEGGRIAVDSQTRGFKNSARKGEDLVASEFNTEKIKALYGEKEANKLIQKLENERAISTTDSKLYQNSQTAMRLKNDLRVPQSVQGTDPLKVILPTVLEGANIAYGGFPGMATAAYLVAKGATKYGVTPAVNAYRGKQNLELTKLLTSQGENRQLLIRLLESRLAGPKTTLQQLKHFALPTLPP